MIWASLTDAIVPHAARPGCVHPRAVGKAGKGRVANTQEARAAGDIACSTSCGVGARDGRSI